MTIDGLAVIAGLQFFLVGPEPAGFAVDNLVFAKAGEVALAGQEPVPSQEPVLAALPLFASTLGLSAFAQK